MTHSRTQIVVALALCAVAGVAPAAHADTSPQEAARRRAARRTPIVEAVEHAAPSVVSIGTTRIVRARFWDWDFLEQREVPGALGSGVIVHPRGYVVTNAHVIHQAEQIAVKLTGIGEESEIPAELVAFDLDNDLALLKLDDAGAPYTAARFGRTDDLMVGETIIAMGSPFGLGRTVTTGVVSALERDIKIRDQVFENLIQTDAAVNQGNSGGALMNILGEWIGVNSAIYSLSGGSDGISFAIPIETVRTFLVSALRPRRQSERWVGLELRERDGAGVEVGTVYTVGPAATAGLKAGSRVVSIGDRPATDAVEAAFALLDESERGAARLRVVDGDRERPVVLPFEEVPTSRLAWENLGLRCAEVTRKISEQTGYREGSGVVVTEVRPGGGADRIGLARGDLLLALARRRVRSMEDLLVVVQTVAEGDLVDVKLLRPESFLGGMRYQTRQARLVVD